MVDSEIHDCLAGLYEQVAQLHATLANKAKLREAVIAPHLDSGERLGAPVEEVHDTIRPPAPTHPTASGGDFEVVNGHGDDTLIPKGNEGLPVGIDDYDLLTSDILRALRTVSEPQTCGQIAMMVKADAKALVKPLARLIEGGFVVRSGKARGTRYAAVVAEAAG